MQNFVLIVGISVCAAFVCNVQSFEPAGFFLYPPNGQIHTDDTLELSGMIQSSAVGEFWGHDDSGSSPAIYRFNNQGVLMQQVLLAGADNVDWEAITRDDLGNLYIADTGDNAKNRDVYQIIQFVEPDESTTQVSDFHVYEFVYADGFSHDCEAVVFWNGCLYLIVKEFLTDQKTKVYKLDALDVDTINQAVELGELADPMIATDAAFSAAHGLLAILTYFGPFFYPVQSETDILNPAAGVATAFFGQAEAIAFSNENLIVANEAGEIWNYPIELYFANTDVPLWSLY